MAHFAGPLGEKPWEFRALQNSQGRGTKPWWLRGQLRRMLAQPSHCWQKGGTRELLGQQPPAPSEHRRKGPELSLRLQAFLLHLSWAAARGQTE